MAVILDTNAFSAFADADEQLRRAIQSEGSLGLPAIVLGEYLYGVQQSRFRARYEQWLQASLPLFEVLAVGEETARHYAEIRRELKAAGSPIPSNDLWIAALAREHRLPIVTRDRHFGAVRGVRIVTW